jgi:signal transduction histidine kinase
MLDMIADLMSLESARARRGHEARLPVAPARVAEKIARTFAEPARQKGLSLHVRVAEPIPAIAGDPAAIEQAFENLVSNAIKYSPPGGTVRLEIDAPGDGTVRAIVSDEGIGIPADALPKLFTEFFRADNARESDAVGSGLGLVHVRETVTAHGGRVEVESEVGRGTRFTVVIPAAKETP